MSTCAISGTVPEEPVVSKKTGHVFERRLVEKHIKTTGSCPVTDQPLALDDLIPLQTASKVIKPRTPSAASIPSLLNTMLYEWDSVMLESYTLKQHNESLRQELSHALYQYDASCRVIARLMKERDAARQALADTQANMAATLARNGGVSPAPSASPSPAPIATTAESETSSAEGDQTINANVIKKMQDTAKELSKDRKQRVKRLTQDAVKKEQLQEYTVVASHPLHSSTQPGMNSLHIHPNDDNLLVTAGNDSTAVVFNKSSGKIVDTLKGHKKKVVDVKFHATSPVVISASQDHTANVYTQNSEGKYSLAHSAKVHTGAVTGVSIHPCGDYYVTCSSDATWAFHDLTTNTTRHRNVDDKITAPYVRTAFHPDGLILGLACEDNQVRIFDVKATKNVATFKGHNSKVTSLTFSENGYYLATADQQGIVKLWDLRKLSNFHTIQLDDFTSCSNAAFDESGSYLALCGSQEVRIVDSKEWNVVKTWSEHKDEVTGVGFGKNVNYFATCSKDRHLKFYSGNTVNGDSMTTSD